MSDRHDEVFKALADPSRRRIVAALCSGPRVAGDLGRLVSLAPNAVSFHLRLLQEARLVSVQRQGRFLWYRVDQEVLEDWKQYSHGLFAVSPDAASIDAHVRRPPKYPPPDQLKPSPDPIADSAQRPREQGMPESSGDAAGLGRYGDLHSTLAHGQGDAALPHVRGGSHTPSEAAAEASLPAEQPPPVESEEKLPDELL